MRASFEHIDTEVRYRQRWISLPAFEFYWHYHPEVELTYILSGSGERIVGDSVESFYAGDHVLVGPDLPHTWTSFGGSVVEDACQAMVIQFRPEVLGKQPVMEPEFDVIRKLLALSSRGIRFNKEVAEEAGRQLLQLRGKQGLHWLTGLWILLDFLGNSTDYTFLSSVGYSPSLNKLNQERISRVFDYIGHNLSGEIRLKQAAGLVYMTETSFSRFFRKNTGMTFNGYVNEIRLSHACRLLTEHPEMSVSSVAWESGFRSSTHFNRMFFTAKGCSPSAFRKINHPQKHQSPAGL